MGYYYDTSYDEMARMFLKYANKDAFHYMIAKEITNEIIQDNKKENIQDSKINFSNVYAGVKDYFFNFSKNTNNFDSFYNYLERALKSKASILDVKKYNNALPSPQLTPFVVNDQKQKELEEKWEKDRAYAEKLVKQLAHDVSFKFRAPSPF